MHGTISENKVTAVSKHSVRANDGSQKLKNASPAVLGSEHNWPTVYVSYELSCGPVAEEFRQRTLASSLGSPQNPPNPPRGRRGIESRTRRNIHRLPHGKKYI